MDQELLVGILLIIVGLAVGLIAVALVLNRRAAEEEQPAETPVPEETAEHGQPQTDVLIPSETTEGSEPVRLPLDQKPAEPAQLPVVGASPSEAAPAPKSESRPIQAGSLSGGKSDRKLVAEIYRDQGSGILILRSGDKEYRTFSQIEDEKLRSELNTLASDPSTWIGEGARATPKPSEPRTPARPGSRSMLEGINSILQRALAEAGNQAKGVQLIPDAAGGVKVLIGLKSYALDEVPDEEIRRLIRESVAEWEASQ